VAPGDDQQVAGRDRVAVQARIGQLILQHRVGQAKGAVRIMVPSCPSVCAYAGSRRC
jgi:hypothetical protein